MNITVILIELAVMCLAFLFFVIGLLLISPLTFISDYPPEVQAEYYHSQNKEASKEKMTIAMKIKKIIALVVFMFVFANDSSFYGRWYIKFAFNDSNLVKKKVIEHWDEVLN